MKKIILVLCLFIVCKKAFSQFDLSNTTQTGIDVVFYNDSCINAYFINPRFYLEQKKAKKEIIYTLRDDMYNILKDTLYIYITDTTLTQFNSPFRIIDSLHKIVGFRLIDSLQPKSFVKFRVNFKAKISYKYLILKYNFSFKREDFFNEKGITVKEFKIPSSASPQ